MPRKCRSGDSQGGQGVKRPAKGLLDCRVMQVLSEQLRAQVFAIIRKQIASPKEIADELSEGLSQVSYHVTILLSCDLIVLDHTTRRGGAVEHFYRAAQELFEEASDSVQSRALWQASSMKRR